MYGNSRLQFKVRNFNGRTSYLYIIMTVLPDSPCGGSPPFLHGNTHTSQTWGNNVARMHCIYIVHYINPDLRQPHFVHPKSLIRLYM